MKIFSFILLFLFVSLSTKAFIVESSLKKRELIEDKTIDTDNSVIEYDLKSEIPQYISCLSSSNIYKFYFPVQYGQNGNFFLKFNNTDYNFNSSIYEYSKRSNSSYLNFNELKLEKTEEDLLIVLKGTYEVYNDNTQYLAFQLEPFITINDFEINLGYGVVPDVTYYLNSGESENIQFFDLYYYFLYLETNKSQIGDIEININYNSKFDKSSQSVQIYECESESWQSCNKTQSTFFSIENYNNIKTILKASYSPKENPTNLILFKFKPIYDFGGDTKGTVRNKGKDKEKESEDQQGGNNALLIVLIAIGILIILAVVIIVIYFYYKKKNSQNMSSLDMNQESPLNPNQ